LLIDFLVKTEVQKDAMIIGYKPLLQNPLYDYKNEKENNMRYKLRHNVPSLQYGEKGR
jgi:hypothetical protein